MGTASWYRWAVLQQNLDVRHMTTVEQHKEMTERLCRWIGRGGHSSRSQTTLNHMWPNGPSASHKLKVGIALWCARQRAARALEPSAIGAHVQAAEHDHLMVSGSPARRALPAESLSWRLDEEEPAQTGSRTTGRRAIVDPEPTQSSQPDLSQPPRLQVDSGTASAATQCALAIFRATQDHVA